MRPSIVLRQLTQLGPFGWGDFAPGHAGRAALGVVVPLAIGWSSGHVAYGAYMALGALPAGIVSFQGETRSRVAAVALASVGMAASTFVGATTAAGAPWLLVPIVALWGYLAGLSVCLGPRAGVAVLQWSIALLIAVGLPVGPAEAAVHAGLVLGGGLLQALLVAASWTVRPGASERAALAATYRSLGAYASGLAAGRSGPPPPTAFPADPKIDDPNPVLPRAAWLAFVDLLEEAERIRASLAALATEAVHGPATDAGEIRGLLSDAASALELIAEAVAAAPAERSALIDQLGQRLARQEIATDAPWRWAGEAMLGQLRAVRRMFTNPAVAPAGHSVEGSRATQILERGQTGPAAALATLRANTTTSTEAGRHALRLAVIAVVAEALVQATGLYQGRWVTLTVFIVLKPDYASTISRGIHRALGTILGAAVGAVTVELAQLGQAGLIAEAGLWVAAGYACFAVNYLLFSLCLTAYVVVILDLLGVPAIPTAEARLFDTVLGSALALVGYIVWPTWQGATAQEKFARLIDTHRAWVAELLRDLAHPGSVDDAHLRGLQTAARRARADAEAATARLAGEPEHPEFAAAFAQRLIAAAARLAHAELALYALVLSRERPASRQDASGDAALHVDALGQALDVLLGRLAHALRTLRPPDPVPALRPLQAALRDDAALRDTALVRATDRLVDAADTLDAILRERSSAVG